MHNASFALGGFATFITTAALVWLLYAFQYFDPNPKPRVEIRYSKRPCEDCKPPKPQSPNPRLEYVHKLEKNVQTLEGFVKSWRQKYQGLHDNYARLERRAAYADRVEAANEEIWQQKEEAEKAKAHALKEADKATRLIDHVETSLHYEKKKTIAAKHDTATALNKAKRLESALEDARQQARHAESAKQIAVAEIAELKKDYILSGEKNERHAREIKELKQSNRELRAAATQQSQKPVAQPSQARMKKSHGEKRLKDTSRVRKSKPARSHRPSLAAQAAKYEQLGNQYDEVKTEKARLQHETTALKAQVEALKKTNDNLKNDISNLSAKNKSLNAANAEKDGSKDQNSDLKNQISRLEQQESSLKTEKEALEKDLRKATTEKNGLHDEANNMKERLTTLAQQKEELEAVNILLNKDIAAEKEMRMTLQVQFDTLRQEDRSSQDARAALLQQDKAMWQQEKQGLEQRNADLQSAGNTLQANFNALQVDSNALQVNFNALQQEYNSLKQSAASSQDQVNTFEQNSIPLEVHTATLQEVKTLQQTNQDLRKRVAGLDGQLRAHKERFSDLEETAADLRRQIFEGNASKLRVRFDQLEKQYQKLDMISTDTNKKLRRAGYQTVGDLVKDFEALNKAEDAWYEAEEGWNETKAKWIKQVEILELKNAGLARRVDFLLEAIMEHEPDFELDEDYFDQSEDSEDDSTLMQGPYAEPVVQSKMLG